MFNLTCPYSPTGDQPQAIATLTKNLLHGQTFQVLKGVTGSGKTFTMANVIKNYNRPTLILAHNKTLAAQLYSEFREFFPDNAVHYFVSYFDYYQPEAYLPATDTYIEKDSAINDEIDRLRHSATASLLTRDDVIIIASVSCIYGIGSPSHYIKMSLSLQNNGSFWQQITNPDQNLTKIANPILNKAQSSSLGSHEAPAPFTQAEFIHALIDMQYDRNDAVLERGNFRVSGDTIDLIPATGESTYRFEFNFGNLESVKEIDSLNLKTKNTLNKIVIFPNTHYATPKEILDKALIEIEQEFKQRQHFFEQTKNYLASQRLNQRVKFDLEMIRETGFVKGIENYSRFLDGRAKGQPPATLLDFFPKDFLLLIDESHMTIPQVRGMYSGDRARKEVLVEHGFRLPSALDNRPLNFGEFEKYLNHVICVSATPGEYELEKSEPVLQIIRPTGLLDPIIEVRKTAGQIDDLIFEIEERVAKKERTLVTTLTKRMAEELSDYLKERGIKTAYIHSDIDTLERSDILRELREGVYDVLVGINLLREGLDLPEVSLVAILDADKEGFLRSHSALIQTIGRAARHQQGKVIMYADFITKSMESAITETMERRSIQQAYNKKHHITPRSVKKDISLGLRAIIPAKVQKDELNTKKIPPEEIPELIKELQSKMRLAAESLDFEQAAKLRDLITTLQKPNR